ncbi:Proteasome assembly chaperone 2 [Phytophthora pseudosyringae]|uniref:Proteasome assembly chaperone 2 n=1 Tax=Phytophthora pseudosyringae TaxID=221518 RepID=A0A8T1VFA5_9STRA|nr:Proteasome assembly chaperone 2 [Phytophthora pseudosyringae]
MEFYPQDAVSAADSAACAALFAEHTLLLVRPTSFAHASPPSRPSLALTSPVLASQSTDEVVYHFFPQPAVSNANLGQLTLDLAINTLLQNGEAFGVELTRVGHLLSEAAPPIAGGAAFATQQPQALCLNLEGLYQSKEKKLTIIQQRAPVLPGRAHAFAQELVQWAVKSKVATLAVVAGCDDMLRHDSNMMSRPIRTIYSAAAAQLDEAFVTRFEGLTTSVKGVQEASETPSSSAGQWAPIRGAGLAPLLHAQCDEQKLPFIAWVMPCAEGNNVPDAAAMATQLFHSLRIAPKVAANPATMSSSMPPMLPFAFPPSWNQLFGRGPDVSLYL